MPSKEEIESDIQNKNTQRMCWIRKWKLYCKY